MAFNPNDPEFIKSARPASAYSNRAFVTVHQEIARLSFGEAPANAGDSFYHTAITMTVGDALALADAIYNVYEDVYLRLPQGTATSTAAEAYGEAPAAPMTDLGKKPGG